MFSQICEALDLNFLVMLYCTRLPSRPVLFEVWDRDNVWNDDLLGKASVVPTVGSKISKTFRLKHGTLSVELSAACAPSLTGSLCEEYAATPNYEDIMRYTKEDQESSGMTIQDAA